MEKALYDRLCAAADRRREIEEQLCDPAVASDVQAATKLMQELSRLSPVAEKFNEWQQADSTVQETKELLEDTLDKDFRALVFEEHESALSDCEKLEEELRILLLPRDPNDDRNVILEIRAGTGGEEGALFAGTLLRMYSMYAQAKGYRISVLNATPTELGGYKEVTMEIHGTGAYSRFKFESGVHRVQRVPETETQGRIHTSAATVAVFPEAEDVEIDINPADLQIDTFRAGGAGGQHINKTESAIRITHLPTGLVVECQDERSQYKNKDKAMKVLKSRLLESERRKQAEKQAGERRSMVGSGDRSEKIRTYNYHQYRVTDHRIGLTLYKIENILNGDLDELIDALITADTAEKLAQSE
ncbi:MAG: peptide chain release factor 1 [Ruminococcaceae bacterium]|nr:peptide chain release factor 1 [Oscillospiraceae bacterium]